MHKQKTKEKRIRKATFRFLFLVSILPLLAFGQDKSLTKTELAKIYSKAIGDFIKAANRKNKSSFDTLYFGKLATGQAGDFPDITLASVIENAQIILISPELGKKSQSERPSRIYINMVGWVNKEKAEFRLFVFSNGFDHQYNYTINYKYDPKLKDYQLENLQFKGPPFDK